METDGRVLGIIDPPPVQSWLGAGQHPNSVVRDPPRVFRRAPGLGQAAMARADY